MQMLFVSLGIATFVVAFAIYLIRFFVTFSAQARDEGNDYSKLQNDQ